MLVTICTYPIGLTINCNMESQVTTFTVYDV